MRVVVTRHPAMVQYLTEIGLIDATAYVIAHAVLADVAGKTVIGTLPLALACHATTIIEVPLALTVEDRGVELTIERIRQIAQPPRAYVVSAVVMPAAQGSAS
jgi:hypothetical protein